MKPIEKIEAATFDGMIKVRASRLLYVLGMLDGLMTASSGPGLDLGKSVDLLLAKPDASELLPKPVACETEKAI